ncbi:MAG: hypothetical protein WCJ57_00525 [Candidatus Falkowbacteria bacterium]
MITLSAQQFNKLALREDILELKNQIDSINKRIDRTFDLLDGLAYKTNNLECDFAANQSAHDRFEGRISRTEKHLELEPLFDY